MGEACLSGCAGNYRERPLARVHPLGAHRAAVLLGQLDQAQFAQHAAGVHLVQALARQWRPLALGAAPLWRRHRIEASSEEHSGEIWHGLNFAAGAAIPAAYPNKD